MGLHTIEFEWDIYVKYPHKIGIKRIGSDPYDTLEVRLDGTLIKSHPAGGSRWRTGQFDFLVDDHLMEIKWSWNTDPITILLVSGNEILARYDDPSFQSQKASFLLSARATGLKLLFKGLPGGLTTALFFGITVGFLFAWIPITMIGGAIVGFCFNFFFPLSPGHANLVRVMSSKRADFIMYAHIIGTSLTCAIMSQLVNNFIADKINFYFLGNYISIMGGTFITSVIVIISDWIIHLLIREPLVDPNSLGIDMPLLTTGGYSGYIHPTTWPPLTKSYLAKQRKKNRAIPVRFSVEEKSSQKNLDPVDCTVFAPASVSPSEMVFVQVFVHIPHQAKKASKLATNFDPNTQCRGFKSLEVMIARGTQLTFNLTISGSEIDDPVQTLIWRGRPESVQFGVMIPRDHVGGTAIGTVTVSQDSVPIGHIKFKLTIKITKDVPQSRPVGDDAKRYCLAFISYASADWDKVIARVQMLKTLSISYFQDALSLNPGDRWKKELYKHIDECDIFLLFWSRSARESKWVRREVNYALSRKHDDEFAPPEIKPVIIEGPPIVAPWPEMSHLHFNDALVYFMTKQER